MLKQIVQWVQITSIIEFQMSCHSYKKIINFEETKEKRYHWGSFQRAEIINVVSKFNSRCFLTGASHAPLHGTTSKAAPLPLPPSPIHWAPSPLGSAKSFSDLERDC